MTPSDAEIRNAVEAALEAHGAAPDRLLEILHRVQGALGFLPPAVVPPIANAIHRSRAEVQGVIGFYHDFRQSPPGAATIHLCRAEACQAMGSRALEVHVQKRLGVGFHETTTDGRYTLEPVYCLGNCACTPSIRVGDDVYARVTPERFDEILGELEVES